MRFIIYLSAIISILFTSSCSTAQSGNYELEPTEFSAKLASLPSSPVLDVRTPEEFAKGHLLNAVNANWNGNDFDKQIAGLDRSKPVFVYCLSGGRSAAAAGKMRADGFTTVYELTGGMMKWRAAALPETTDPALKSGGMTMDAFLASIDPSKTVLVDFYADWCVPCKTLTPVVEQIADSLKNDLILICINADDNQAICRELKIDALPTLQIYKHKLLSWNNVGLVDKLTILKAVQ